MAGMVGPGDPACVGRASFGVLAEHIAMRPDMCVLDFGCGIGRLAVPLATFLSQGSYVGIDIVPTMIQFCRNKLQALLTNCEFFLSSSRNPLYDSFRTETPIEEIELCDWANRNANRFDVVCAFSVLTHLNPAMARSVLEAFAMVARPESVVFATVFLDSPSNPADRRLSFGETWRDCYPDRSMAWVVHEVSSLAALAGEYGFLVRRLHWGCWRGTSGAPIIGDCYQDILILAKRPVSADDFDTERYLELHPDVRMSGIDPLTHYLAYGRREGRATT
jgi:SAM-dependent methyltransferase